jgi:hypothetical protein
MAFLMDRSPAPCTFLTASRPPRRAVLSCVPVVPPGSGLPAPDWRAHGPAQTPRKPLRSIGFSIGSPGWMHLVFCSDLLHRLKALERTQDDSCLEFRTVDSSLVFHVSVWGFPPRAYFFSLRSHWLCFPALPLPLGTVLPWDDRPPLLTFLGSGWAAWVRLCPSASK